jgi:hypothetical protein
MTKPIVRTTVAILLSVIAFILAGLIFHGSTMPNWLPLAFSVPAVLLAVSGMLSARRARR